MSDPQTSPVPLREALDQPRLDAEDLHREIGDSEAWDEASDNVAAVPSGPGAPLE